MKTELDLLKILNVIRKNLLAIILSTLVCAVAAYFITAYLIAPKYAASVSLYVFNNSNAQSGAISYADLNTSQQLVQTYVVVIKSNSVLDRVAEALDNKYTSAEIRGMLTAQSIDDTEAFKITVTAGDPEIAMTIANAILDIAPNEILRVVKAGNVEVIDYATLPEAPISPSKMKNTAIGALIGCVLMAGIAILRFMLDTVIHSEEDITAVFDLPIIGAIPNIDQHGSGSSYKYSSGGYGNE